VGEPGGDEVEDPPGDPVEEPVTARVQAPRIQPSPPAIHLRNVLRCKLSPGSVRLRVAPPARREADRPRLLAMLACPRCATANGDEARFCQACGAELSSVQEKREERKLVSALFVDLVGSTSRAEKQDPEELRDALAKYHATAKTQIERFGGAV